MSGPSLASLIVWHDSRMTDWPSVQPGERGRSVQVMRCRRRRRLHLVTTLNQRQNWHGPTIPSFNDLGPLPSSIYSRNFPRTNAWKMQTPEAPICHDSCPLGEQPSSMVDAVQPSSASPATPSSGIVICLFCLKPELTIHVAIASHAQVVVTLAA